LLEFAITLVLFISLLGIYQGGFFMSVGRQNDIIRAKNLLKSLGYTLDGEIDVHTQFMIKYKSEFEKNPTTRKRGPYRKHTKKRRKKNSNET